ncbi:hemicentin-1-like [Arctopsyche grandis]|uniref:hemicentin-1-like n=1 Tax=Arctopsyche grandis TaxID=121162 RepID=UPI00406D68F4
MTSIRKVLLLLNLFILIFNVCVSVSGESASVEISDSKSDGADSLMNDGPNTKESSIIDLEQFATNAKYLAENIINSRESFIKGNKIDGGKSKRPLQSSLAFVFDTTGSMWDDLVQLRKGAALILDSMLQREHPPIINYVLVPYNDPDVPEAIVTTNDTIFKEELENINVYGGGDCPEMSVTAIKKALNASLPYSYIYVFTDASAVDHVLVDEVLSLIQRKKSQIVFVLTGDCGDKEKPSYQVYEQMAAASSGQIFHLGKTDVIKILQYVNETLDTNKVNLGNVINPSGYDHKHKVIVDDTLKQVTVSVAGEAPRLTITDPHGEQLRGPPRVIEMLDLSKIKIVNIINPEPGNWTINVGSTEKHSVKVTGISELNFDFGFSLHTIKKFSETTGRPLQGTQNNLLIKIANSFDKVKQLNTVDIIDISGKTLFEIPLSPLKGAHEPHIYETPAFLPPDHFFYIAINGIDIEGNEFRRIGSNAIQHQSPEKPFVTVEDEIKIPLNHNVTLKCNVESLIPVSVWWFRNRKPVQEKQNHLQSAEVEYVINNADSTTDGVYTCRATNLAGSSTMSTTVIIIAPPPKVSMLPQNITVKPETEIHLECLIESQVELSKVSMYFIPKNKVNGIFKKEQLDPTMVIPKGQFVSYMHTLMTHNNSEGLYVCEAESSAGKSKDSAYFTILKTLTIKVHPQIIEYQEGEIVSIFCHVHESKFATWKIPTENKDYKTSAVEISETKIDNTNEILLTLDIRGTNKYDEGFYNCSSYRNVSGDIEYVTAVAETRFVQKPKIKDELEKELLFQLNEAVVLDCDAVGIPKPSIIWTLPNKMEIYKDISENEILMVNNNDQLLIKNIKISDEGVYSCKAENQYGNDKKEYVINVWKKINFIEKLNNITVNISDSVTLTCKVDGIPMPNVSWYYNENFDSAIHIGESVNLHNVSLTDAGKYTCIAKNDYEEVDDDLYLNITGSPPKVFLKPQSNIFLPGRSIEMQCSIESQLPILSSTLYFLPKPSVNSGIEQKHILNTNMTINNDLTVHTYSFVTSEDTEGLYGCMAVNLGGTDTKENMISVLPPLKIIASPISLDFEDGGDIEFTCNIFGTKFGSWLKSDETERSITDFGIDISSTPTDNDDGILISMNIKNATIQHEGAYTCIGSRGVSNVKESANFTVRTRFVQKPLIINMDEMVLVEVGKDLKLTCANIGIPKPTIEWIIPDNTKINENTLLDEGIQIVGDTLTIRNANVQHQGNYTCRVQNSIGMVEDQTMVRVWSQPAFSENLKNQTVNIYGAINLTCSVSGIPKPNINWYHSDELFNQQTEVGKDAVLYIKNAGISDGGKYTCKVENENGAIEDSFYLEISGLYAPKILKGSEKIVVKEGDKIEVDCKVIEGEPKPEIIWQYSPDMSNHINIEDANEQVTLNVSESLFTIEYALQDHAGNYTCIAANALGSDQYKFQIVVHEPPHFPSKYISVDNNNEIIYGEKSVESVAGEQVAFKCEVIGNPKPLVTWSKDGFPVQFTNTIYTDDNNSLTISNTRELDAGVYSCYASNFLGYLQKNFTLLVLVRPVISNEIDDPVLQYVEGQMIVLPCLVHGNPVPEVNWVLNDEVLNPSERLQLDLDNSLRFVANLTDSGIYQCEAFNRVGNSSQEYLVVVFVPPTIYPEENEMIRITPGSPAVLDCHAVGFPEPNIRWSKNGELLVKNSTDIMFNDYGRLNITNVTDKTAGKYMCDAENNAGLSQKMFYVILNEPPVILPSEIPSNIQLLKGEEEFNIPCRASGNPFPFITWLKDKKYITNNFHTNVEKDGTLVLRYVTENLSGVYTCQAANSEGSIEIDYNIQVIAPPVIQPKDDDQTVTAIEGSTAVLECPLKPIVISPKIEWYKGSVLIVEHVNKTQMKLVNVSRDDADEYSCVVTNAAGRVLADFSLVVQWPPTIVDDGDDNDGHIHVLEGDPMNLICNVNANPTADIQWVKDSEVIGEIAPVLRKKYAKAHHAGVHICIASNSLGQTQKKFEVHVSAPPKIDGSDYHNIEVHLKQPVKLECNAKGIPKPNIKWNTISSPDWKIVGDGRVLKTFNITSKSNGVYTCEASNSVGSAIKRFNITVLEPPIVEYIQLYNMDVKDYINISAVKEHSHVKLSCVFSGSHPSKVSWIKNGKVVNEESALTSNVSDLIFENLMQVDAGKYTCMVKNKAGVEEMDVLLDVLYPPQIIYGPHELLVKKNKSSSIKMSVLESQSIKLNCYAYGNPLPDIYWYKDRKYMGFYDSNMVTEEFGQTLVVKKVRREHDGNYTCVAKNSAGEDKKNFKVDVLTAPTVEQQQDASLLLTAKKGQDVHLECPVSGNPKPYIRWLKHPYFEMQSENYSHVTMESDNSIMIIKNVSVSDGGNYSCIATNTVGMSEILYSVEILQAPTFLPEDRKKLNLNDDGLVTTKLRRAFQLICGVIGYPEPEITWYKEGYSINPNKNREALHISLDGQYFNIMDAVMGDSGKYSCKAENKVGMVEKEFKVKILVPAEWSMWTMWSSCNASCGPGVQRRTRKCQYYGDMDSIDAYSNDDISTNESFYSNTTEGNSDMLLKNSLQNRKWLPENLLDKSSCSGDTSEFRKCFIAPCKIDGGWSSWSDWTSCSVRCGPGSKKRYRTCTNPPPKYGGLTCQGPNDEQGVCQGSQCSKWSNWTPWSACSVSCGKGMRTRSRSCDGPIDTCLGNYTEVTYCLQRYCPVDGGWGQWNAWSSCSSSCGVGQRKRIRECNQPIPKWKGKSCKGANLQIEQCINPSCDIDRNVFKKNNYNKNAHRANLIVKGNLNGSPLPLKMFNVDVDENFGQQYVNASLQDLIPNKVDDYLPHMTFLVTPVQVDDKPSRTSVTKSKLPLSKLRTLPPTRSLDRREDSQIQFSTGERVQFFSKSQKPSDSGELNIEITIDGTTPTGKREKTTITIGKNYKEKQPYINIDDSGADDDNEESCSTGYTFDPHEGCIDINECEIPNNVCHSTQMCENLPGSYNCLCELGYLSFGAGQRCLDINECSQNIHNCSHECLNAPGSFYCICPSMYHLSDDQKTCIREGVINPSYQKSYVDRSPIERHNLSENGENILLTRISPKRHNTTQTWKRRPRKHDV